MCILIKEFGLITTIFPRRLWCVVGGDVKQNVDPNWKGYICGKQKPGELEYDLWTGDTLARLVEEHILDEYVFHEEIRGLMRKTLAVLDQNEREPVFFYQLVEQVLFERVKSDDSLAKKLKVLRLVNLSVGVVAKWALSVKNTRPAILCAERALLVTWDFLRQHDLLNDMRAKATHFQLLQQYQLAANTYVDRVGPECQIPDGLVSWTTPAEGIEYPLRIFEVIGLFSSLGLSLIADYGHASREDIGCTANKVADLLVDLIKNNPGAVSPQYDDHATEISLGLLLLYKTDRLDAARSWLTTLWNRVLCAYAIKQYFPVCTDNYEDLLDMQFARLEPERLQHLMSISTIIVTIAEWIAILGIQQDYQPFREAVLVECTHMNLQLWYPNAATESELYRKRAGRYSGSMCISIELPEKLCDLQIVMRKRLDEGWPVFKQLSCVRHRIKALALIASRHFRTPVIPAYWQELLPSKSNSE